MVGRFRVTTTTTTTCVVLCASVCTVRRHGQVRIARCALASLKYESSPFAQRVVFCVRTHGAYCVLGCTLERGSTYFYLKSPPSTVRLNVPSVRFCRRRRLPLPVDFVVENILHTT